MARLILEQWQIDEIFEIMDNFNAMFISQNIGVDKLSRNDLRILKRFGINSDNIRQKNLVDYVYKFGMLSSGLKFKRTSKFNFQTLKKFIQSGKFLPLNDVELFTLDVLKEQVTKDVNNANNRHKNDLLQIVITKEQDKKYAQLIKKEAIDAVKERKTKQELASILANKTNDWNRDFTKIADYVMHSAFNHGRAMSMLRDNGDKCKVWYNVHKDACDHCKRVYLKNTRTREPKIFELLFVISNGSNIGVNMKELKPSLYSLHPHCRCEIQLYVENTTWDNTKQRFILSRNDYGVKRKSKIKITYG